MPSEREQRVRAAVNAVLRADRENWRGTDGLAEQIDKLVAIACEPEAAPYAAEIEAAIRRWRRHTGDFPLTEHSYRQHQTEVSGAFVVYGSELDEAVTLMRRAAQPATANELAIRELEAVLGQDPSLRIRCWLEQPSIYTREMVAVLRFAVAVLGDKVGPALAHDKKFVWQCKCGCKNIVAVCSKCSATREAT